MKDNISAEKSLEFAIRIVNLYKFLTSQKKEYVLSKQLLRCGTSIGANIAEAQHAQSRADFVAKMHIALKESEETMYWLKLLYRTDFLSKAQYHSICTDNQELIHILTAICKSAQST